jgi:hypothetical protein
MHEVAKYYVLGLFPADCIFLEDYGA